MDIATEGTNYSYHDIRDALVDIKEDLIERAQLQATADHGANTFGEYYQATRAADAIESGIKGAMDTIELAHQGLDAIPDEIRELLRERGAEATDTFLQSYRQALHGQFTDHLAATAGNDELHGLCHRAGQINNDRDLVEFLKEIHANHDGQFGEDSNEAADYTARLYTEHLTREATSYIDDVANPHISDEIKTIVFKVADVTAGDLSAQAAAQEYTQSYLTQTGADPEFAAAEAEFRHPTSTRPLEDAIQGAKFMSDAYTRQGA